VARLDREKFLSDDSLELDRRALISGPIPVEVLDLAHVPVDQRRVGIDLSERSDGGYELVTRSDVPFLLNSSEKLTPELRVLIDGRVHRALAINSMFAAAVVPAGEHRVVFERQIGRGWWPLAGCAILLVGVAAWFERRRDVSIDPAR
jgi:hypothetical protein